jgi:hypothetical protein
MDFSFKKQLKLALLKSLSLTVRPVNFFFAVFSFLFSFFIGHEAYSYPQFIGHGYARCLSCHENPAGNGPLNDYGRALNATLISSRLFVGKDTTEEELGKQSNLFWDRPPEKFPLRFGADYRGLYFMRNAQDKERREGRYISMQMDAHFVAKSSSSASSSQWLLTGTFGKTPKSENPQLQNQERDSFRSREHYVGYRNFNQGFGIYAGLLDKTFGLRVPDHIAFSRVIPGLAQNDQTHGVMGHFYRESFDLFGHYFVGNLTQEEEFRQKGFALSGEYHASRRLSLGGSVMQSASSFFERQAFAFQTRVGTLKGSSILAEVGQHRRSSKSEGRSDITSRYLFLQHYFMLQQGFYVLATIEQLKADTSKDLSIWRLSPGIQWFLAQGIEWRVDLYQTRTYADLVANEDNWTWTSQLHLSF